MRRLAAALVFAAAAAAAAQDAPPAPPPPPTEPSTPEPARAPQGPDAAEKRARRERLARLAGTSAAVLVLAADDAPGLTGATQNRDYTYLSPFAARGAAVLVTLDAGDAPDAPPTVHDRLYLRARNPQSERWTGPVAGPGDATRDAGLFAASSPVDALAADLALALKKRSTLFVSAGGVADGAKLVTPLLASLRAAMPGVWVRVLEGPAASADDFAESVRRALPARLPREKTPDVVLAALPTVDVRSSSRLLGELRELKSAAEIACIRAATDATVAGMLDALRAARPGMLETEVAGYVEFRCRLGGCTRQAYDSIAGAGPNSCVLHYSANARALADGDMVVMDIGGEYRDYATDVTRSFPANGKFTEAQAKVYDAVLAAQEAAIAAVRPGVTMKEVHAAAAAVLKERGLVQYFPHGTCHSVGLDVHDLTRPDAKLAPGFVLTVEPGVYIEAEGLGVRIEDTVLVTDTGCEVLSAALPKSREAIERLMAEDAPYPSSR